MENILLYKVNTEQSGMGSWLYAYGFLASRENRFFNESQLQQLFSSNSEEQLLNVIREANYQGDTVEQALNNSIYEDVELLYSLIPDYGLLKMFLLFNEGHNLKLILRATLSAKKKTSLVKLENLLLGPYLTEPSEILHAVRNSDESQLPKWMIKAVKQAQKAYLDSYDMSNVDLLVDRLMWQELINQLDALGSKWLKEFYLLQADLINLEILLRSKNLHLSEQYFSRSVLPQGNITVEEWQELFVSENSKLPHALEKHDLAEFIPFIDTYYELGQASIFSQQFDVLMMKKIQETKQYSSGIEKVAAYYLVREIERTNIKLAKACYLHSIPEDRSNQIMRPCFLRRF